MTALLPSEWTGSEFGIDQALHWRERLETAASRRVGSALLAGIVGTFRLACVAAIAHTVARSWDIASLALAVAACAATTFEFVTAGLLWWKRRYHRPEQARGLIAAGLRAGVREARMGLRSERPEVGTEAMSAVFALQRAEHGMARALARASHRIELRLCVGRAILCVGAIVATGIALTAVVSARSLQGAATSVAIAGGVVLAALLGRLVFERQTRLALALVEQLEPACVGLDEDATRQYADALRTLHEHRSPRTI